MTAVNPEIANRMPAGGIETNYHDEGRGPAILFIHGSGPGVSAFANWRLTIPALSGRYRVVAPDMVGFGFSDRPKGVAYSKETWVKQAIGLMDALKIDKAHVVGNSFGGAIALAMAIKHPDRVGRLVLMGAVGVPFTISPGLDAVWGYEPSLDAMKKLLDIFAYDRGLVTDELAELRYRASIRPGFQESFSAMFPAPRQRWVDALASADSDIRAIPHETLIVHGRDDKVIPLANALTLLDLIERSQLHVFGRCGHWVQIEHAQRFANLLDGFFSEQSSQPSS
jgi:2-hydroxymuconate-semialdehyde hydrolase